MAEIKTGGPAFPFEGGDNNGIEPSVGMTLRDYFAAKSMSSGLIRETYSEWQLKAWFGDRIGITREEIIARAAYEVADAMIAAREGGAK
ncbi:hypothetical protein [Ochrobactrum chromiisoli]|uniref:Uncharacterized protein n=1 Tax=Ochrobactrum chromiisoli TaxID=2993941 RepID=A0ABT3QQH0_9HYPH|nr:hypothetical protein [Ochrobactrum chromiisoli]MCX2697855.1 hypothetical protein [Ochrobactrum chromiisoli]